MELQMRLDEESYFKIYSFKIKGGKFSKVCLIATNYQMALDRLIDYCIENNCEPDDTGFDIAFKKMIESK